MPASGPPAPLRLHVLSHPRTASNLFCKFFSEHPKIKQHLYTFTFAHTLGPEAQTLMKSEAMDNLNETYAKLAEGMTYQASLDKIEKLIAETEAEGKIPLLKDHSIFLIDAAQAQKLLSRHREIPPKPIILDKKLDIPEEKRELGTSKDASASGKPFNPSYLPDRFLKTFAPIFFIRHPVKQIESWYRTSIKSYVIPIDHPDFEMNASYKFTRELYEYYVAVYRQESSDIREGLQNGNGVAHAVGGGWPVVIDGDDLINDPEDKVNKFCELTGLDSSGVIYKWEKEVWLEDPGPIQEAFFGTLSKSDGVKKNLYPKEPDLAASSQKWREEWGDEVANALVKYAEAAMDDYEYLYQFRL